MILESVWKRSNFSLKGTSISITSGRRRKNNQRLNHFDWILFTFCQSWGKLAFRFYFYLNRKSINGLWSAFCLTVDRRNLLQKLFPRPFARGSQQFDSSMRSVMTRKKRQEGVQSIFKELSQKIKKKKKRCLCSTQIEWRTCDTAGFDNNVIYCIVRGDYITPKLFLSESC